MFENTGLTVGQKAKRFMSGLSTVKKWAGFGGSSLGFYIPYRYAESIQTQNESDTILWLKKKWDLRIEEFQVWIDRANSHNQRFDDFKVAHPRNPNQPRFNQDWFPGLDGAMAYTMVHHYKPKNIIEVGSGHSTRFMAQAVQDAQLETHIHSIDPVPRREIDQICSQITRSTVEKVDPKVFTCLQTGDILFIDASHIFMSGTDLDYLVTEVLPFLADGVIVHVHDIFLPNGYPEDWK